MRILILSDSHGQVSALQRALEVIGPCDYLMHAGDITLPPVGLRASAGATTLIPGFGARPAAVLAVRGNCDQASYGLAWGLASLPEQRLLDLDGHRFYLCHGHKASPRILAKQARASQAQIVVTGHTHCRDLRSVAGVVWLNPGSCALPRDGCPTAALYEANVLSLWDLRQGKMLQQLQLGAKCAKIEINEE